MKRITALAIVALAAALWACGEARNRPPVIESFSVQPTVIPVGGQARALCQAYDPDGDRLTYRWFASSGCSVEAIRDGLAVVTCNLRGEAIVGCTVADPLGAQDEASVFISVQ